MSSKNSTAICGICQKVMDSLPLICIKCKRTFHDTCAKPNENVLSWECMFCTGGFLNPPPAPKGNRAKSVMSLTSNRRSSCSSSKRLDTQLQLLKEKEDLLLKQSKEKEAALAEKIRILEERESYNKKIQEEIENRHKIELELLKEKTVLLESLHGSQAGSDKSSTSGAKAERIQDWTQKVNKETNINIDQVRTHKETNIRHTHLHALPRDYQHHRVSTVPIVNNSQTDHSLPPRLCNSSYLATKEMMELPKFDGSVEKWPIFISKYENTFSHFTPEVNLIRLQNCLQGAAKVSVEDLLLLPGNLEIIISTLRHFFGNPEYIINSLLDKINKEGKPKIDDFDSIIAFALSVRNICSTMQAAQLSEHLWNPTLLQGLEDKLPYNYKIDWADIKSEAPAVNIEVFSNWIYSKALKLTSVLTRPPQLKQKLASKVNFHQNLENEKIESIEKRSCFVCSGVCKSVRECEKFISSNYEEKLKVVDDEDLCRCCLRKHWGKCRFVKPCGSAGCTSKHHPLLHRQNVSGALNSHHRNPEASVLFKIIPITIYGKETAIDTFALMDDGSSVTLIEEELANQLNLHGVVPDPLCLQWTSNEYRDELQSYRFDTTVSAAKSCKKMKLCDVRTVSKLCLPKQTLLADDLKKKFPYLKDIEISSYENATPRILIGLNNPLLMLGTKSKCGERTDPIATKTPLGWVVYGGGEQTISNVFHICECKLSMDRELSSIVQQFITMENLQVSPTQEGPLSDQNKRAIDLMNSNVKYNGTRYECSLLWSYDNVTLPDSRTMALRRLQCLEKKCQRQPQLRITIEGQIKSYLEKGYIREVLDNELENFDGTYWYLPIFTVSNPNKPQKVRIVWDAAAKVFGFSLNSVLLKGPDLLVSLPGVLMRFREKQFAVTGDIREMFHQINVRESDQHFQRFFWRFENEKTPRTFIMKVMTFGASCSPTLAQYVKNLNASKFEKEFPNAARAIKSNHYVDDWLESVDTEAEAIQLAQEVKKIHHQGGFEMGSWISNSSYVMSVMGETENIKKNLDISSEDLTEKVLGMWWAVNDDAFTYSLRFNKGDEQVLRGNDVPTKRQLLRILMSVYDPLGMLAHFMAHAKILLQLIWRKGISWDEDVPEELLPFWYEWINKLPSIEKIRISRFYFQGVNDESKTIELHVFVDGSEEGYAATCYIRITARDEIKCMLIAAKSRVAPLKHHSIPRLELLAALLGVRLANNIQKEHTLNFNKRIFWTDSKTVCCWIRSQHRRYKQFVACRIGEILESTNEKEWRWLPSSKNVADLATRMKVVDLSNDSEWFKGPQFLYDEPITTFEDTSDSSIDNNEELRPHIFYQLNFHCIGVSPEKFSNWNRLLRTHAYVLRFVNNIKAKARLQNVVSGPLNSAELQLAEQYIFRQIQEDSFADEIAELKNSSPPKVNKKSSLYKLMPFLDDFGILRRKGRLEEAEFLTYEAKNPVILPHKHHVTSLLIQWYHRRYHHHNHEVVVNEMRQKFCYPQLRKELRRIRNSVCQKCRNELAKPKAPIMANLPSCRLQPFTRPFTFIGLDYFGPIVVCIGRRNEKRWGVLITCLTFRAVHLESVHSLTTSSCILALRNFINRRGQPREIFSDNATTFKGASSELKDAVLKLDQNEIAQEFNETTTSWKFITPAAAHMGGAWERLVGHVKRNLYHISTLKNIQDELFRSLLVEVENIVNSRPLTYIPIDSDGSEALTPNHFLVGSSSGHKPLVKFDCSGQHLKHSWITAQFLSNVFYKRFLKDIIPELNRRAKWFDSSDSDMKVGDIVLVLDDNIPKFQFPKGKVMNVYPGKDGRIRTATVKTQKGCYNRPVTKLAILDVRETVKEAQCDDGSSLTEGSVAAADI